MNKKFLYSHLFFFFEPSVANSVSYWDPGPWLIRKPKLVQIHKSSVFFFIVQGQEAGPERASLA